MKPFYVVYSLLNETKICLLHFFNKTNIFFLIYSTQDAIFPAITICPNYLVGYKNSILNQYGLVTNDIRDSIKFPQNLNISLSKFFEKITYNIEDIVYYIYVGCSGKDEGSNYSYFMFMDEANQTEYGKYFSRVS